MQAISHLKILREKYNVKPGDPQPAFGSVLICDLCRKDYRSVVALDVEWHYSAEDAAATSDVKLCRSCLTKALIRLDQLDDEDAVFEAEERAIMALDKAKQENGKQ